MRVQGILYDKSKAFALDVIALYNELREKKDKKTNTFTN